MASERLILILKSRGAPFSAEQLEKMSDQECWEWLYTTFPGGGKDSSDPSSSMGPSDVEKEDHLKELSIQADPSPVTEVSNRLKHLFVRENAGRGASIKKVRAFLGQISFRGLFRKKLDSQIGKDVGEDPESAVQEEPPVMNHPQKATPRIPPPFKREEPLLRKLVYCVACLAGVGLIIFVGRIYLKTHEEIPAANFRFGHSILEAKSDLLPQEKNSHPVEKPGGGPALTPPAENGKSRPEAAPPLKEIDHEPSPATAAARPMAAPPSPPAPEVSGPPAAGLKREIQAKPGDSIYTIARKAYHVANTSVVDRILDYNSGLSKSHHLTAGQKVYVPDITEESLLVPSSKGTCKVRLGTFLKPEYSSFLKEQPGLKGKKIEVRPHKVPSGQTWYRVVAGPFSSREEALKVIHALRERGASPYFPKGKRLS